MVSGFWEVVCIGCVWMELREWRPWCRRCCCWPVRSSPGSSPASLDHQDHAQVTPGHCVFMDVIYMLRLFTFKLDFHFKCFKLIKFISFHNCCRYFLSRIKLCNFSPWNYKSLHSEQLWNIELFCISFVDRYIFVFWVKVLKCIVKKNITILGFHRIRICE